MIIEKIRGMFWSTLRSAVRMVAREWLRVTSEHKPDAGMFMRGSRVVPFILVDGNSAGPIDVFSYHVGNSEIVLSCWASDAKRLESTLASVIIDGGNLTAGLRMTDKRGGSTAFWISRAKIDVSVDGQRGRTEFTLRFYDGEIHFGEAPEPKSRTVIQNVEISVSDSLAAAIIAREVYDTMLRRDPLS